MAARRWVLFLLSVAMMAALAGCGGVNTFDTQNPPPPPTSKPAISMATAPAAPAPEQPVTVQVNGTVTLTAMVTGDPNNYGVDWLLTCPIKGNCGTLSVTHTDSGTDIANCATAPASCTTYTPPTSFTGNRQPATIVAYATADHGTNALTAINVTAFGNNLSGTYVLQAQGVNSNGGPNYQLAGVFMLDGNGNITGGEQTVNFLDTNGGAFVSKIGPIVPTGGAIPAGCGPLPSSYFLGPDGRGTIIINTGDTDIGFASSAPCTETFTFVYLNSSQALIVQGDLADAQGNGIAFTGASASGTMDLQTSTAAPSGGYAFVISGSDFSQGVPAAIGGILNVDSLSSGKGSVVDQNLNGTLLVNQKPTGSISAPDSFGAVTLNLTVPKFSSPSLTFTGYIVDATHIKLIESDNSSGAGLGSTAGFAIGQGSDTATFSGAYVFGVTGVDLDIGSPASLTSAGVFNADAGALTLTGFTDTLLQANFFSNPSGTCIDTGARISATFDITYSVDKAGIGHVNAPFPAKSISPQPPCKGFGAHFLFYLTGNGTTALILAAGNPNYPFIGTGIAYPQATSSLLTFNGDYGSNFTQFSNGSESDATASLAVNSTAQTLSGIADVVTPGLVTPDASFTGTSTSTGCSTVVNGCFAGTLQNQPGANGNLAFVSPSQPFPVDFYIIDQDHGFFAETDLVDPSSPSGVVSFGYYARASLPSAPAAAQGKNSSGRPAKRHRR